MLTPLLVAALAQVHVPTRGGLDAVPIDVGGPVPERIAFLGGDRGERIQGIWVHRPPGASAAAVFVAGDTASDLEAKYPPGAFPGYDQTRDGGPDGFVARLSPDLERLEAWTYLGGSLGGGSSSPGNDRVYTARTDAAGNVYAFGISHTREFFTDPAVPALGGGLRGRRDVFVAKLSHDLAALHWIVRLGGEQVEQFAPPNELEQGRNTLWVEPDGTCYVSGGTNNPDFFDGHGVVPVFDHVARRQQQAGLPVWNPGNFDAFVAKLAPDGQLAWGTFLGGDGDESAYSGIARRKGGLFVAGNVNDEDPKNPGQFWGQGHPGEGLPGTDCPAQPAWCRFQPSYAGGAHAPGGPLGFHHIVGGDGFVARLREADGTLVWTTYLGGSGFDEISGNEGLLVAPGGQLYLCGSTRSADLPLAAGQPAFDAQLNASGDHDGFVAILDRTGRRLLASTYLGGEGFEELSGLALDPGGFVYVSGDTDSGATASSGFRTAGYPTTQDAFQCANYMTYPAGGTPPVTAMVTRLAPRLDALAFSSYFGGSRLGGTLSGPSTRDRVRSIAWDAGWLLVAGDTNSRDLAEVHAVPPLGLCPPLSQPIPTGAAPYLHALDPANLGIEEDGFAARVRFLVELKKP